MDCVTVTRYRLVVEQIKVPRRWNEEDVILADSDGAEHSIIIDSMFGDLHEVNVVTEGLVDVSKAYIKAQNRIEWAKS